MKLTFQSPHMSIVEFPPTELPSFTLLTGLNGSGKTHFLKSLAGGHIGIDAAPNFKEDIRYFDWTTMVPQDTGLFQSESLIQERVQILQNLQSIRLNTRVLDAVSAVARKFELPAN